MRCLAASLFLLLAVPGLAHAQADPPAPRSENPFAKPEEAAPAPTGQLTRPPELKRFVEATFPPAALETGVTGSVGLLVDLDERGVVTAVEVTEPAGHGFDEAAVAAVKQFEFTPAEIDGKPAPVRIGYRYVFTLQKEVTPAPPPEAVVNFRGRLLQRGTREILRAADIAVAVGETPLTAVSDDEGRFELAGVPPGKHPVVVTASGFDKFETEEEFTEGQATEVTYYVRKHVYGAYETVVRGKRERKDVAKVELKQEEIRLVPGSAGDSFRVVQNLPGVARVPYSFGLLVVRGGRPQDTRVYIDGVWIPIMFHFAGLTSVYNSDLLANLTFLPGNFSARDGRGIGGVVEAETRPPAREYHGYANINAVDSTLLVEGPISQNWAFSASGRVSYVDLILQEVLPASIQFVTAPRYGDYQLRLEWAPKDGPDRVSLQLYGSHDVLKMVIANPAMLDPEGRNDAGASADFLRQVTSWRHAFSPTLSNKLTVALGYDAAATSAGADLKGTLGAYTVQVRDGVSWEAHPRLSLEAGTDSYFGYYFSDVVRPQIPPAGQVPDPLVSRQLAHAKDNHWLIQPSLYLEGVWKPFDSTKIVPGVRLDYEGTLEYVTLDPRLSVFQTIVEGTVLKGGIGLYQQPPDFRFQQWTREFGNPYLGPERSVQAMLGVEQRITDAINLDVQLYYKWMDNLMWPSTRQVERDGELVIERYNNGGVGRTYGAEILLRHELTSRFFGWIAYSFGRSERRSDVEGWRNGQFDQPHHLIVVASYKWPWDIVTGVRFQYSSGNLATPVDSTVYDADADLYMPMMGKPFSVRGPEFISLDLRIDKRFVFQQWMVNVFLDVQNVTNNKNGEFIYYSYDYKKTQYVRGMPVFPQIGIKAEF